MADVCHDQVTLSPVTVFPLLTNCQVTGGRDGTMEGAMGYRDRCNRGIRGVIDITKTLASRTGRKGV